MRRRDLGVSLIAVALTAGLTYGLASRSPSRPADISTLTPDADALLSLSPRTLIRSRAWREIVTANEGDTSMRALAERCGMNPFSQLNHAVVSLRPEGDVLTVVATGDLDREALVSCLQAALGDTGTQARMVDIAGRPALVSRGGSAAAFLTRSTLALSDEEGIAQLIQRTEGDASPRELDAMLVALRDSLPRGAINLVARIDGERATVLERLTKLSVFDRVQALSASLVLGDPLQLRAVLSTPNESAAVEEILQAQLSAFGELTLVRISGLAQVLEEVSITTDGDRVELSLDVSIEDAAELAKLLAR